MHLRERSLPTESVNWLEPNHIAFADLLGKIAITSIGRRDSQMMSKRVWVRAPSPVRPPVIPVFLMPLCQASWKDAWQKLFTGIRLCCPQPRNCQTLPPWLTPPLPSLLGISLLLHNWGTWVGFCPPSLLLSTYPWQPRPSRALLRWCSRWERSAPSLLHPLVPGDTSGCCLVRFASLLHCVQWNWHPKFISLSLHLCLKSQCLLPSSCLPHSFPMGNPPLFMLPVTHSVPWVLYPAAPHFWELP